MLISIGVENVGLDGTPFSSPKVSHSGGQNFRNTATQLSHAAGTTDQARSDYWESRYGDSKDPVSPLAVNIVDNAYLLGCMANERLLQFAGKNNINIDLTDVGVDLMVAHVDSVEADNADLPGKLSAVQVAVYHHNVFGDLGLGPRTFGGTPFTGIPTEAGRTKIIWCPSCE